MLLILQTDARNSLSNDIVHVTSLSAFADRLMEAEFNIFLCHI